MSQSLSTISSATTAVPKMSARRTVAPLLVLIGFALLGLWYSLVIPAFETPDEIYHYAFARHLAQGNPLPIQTIEADGPWEHEGTQAPLYYLILGRLLSGVDQSDFEQVGHINPRANLGTPTYPGNKNFMLYSAISRPLTGTNLAVHIGRWFSLLLSLGTLWFTFSIARLAFPRSPTLALLVMVTVAAIPQFAFIGASVSNDPLVILVATATLYWMLVLLRREITAPISLGDWSILGLLLSLAAISKLQGLSLYVLAAVVVPLLCWQRRDWRLFIRAGLILGLSFVVVAGWWYWRNYQLYQDIFAIGQLLEIEGLRTESQTWAAFWGELRGLRYSFWGLFGWFSILLPVWIYRLLDAVTILAAAGMALWIGEAVRRDRPANWLRKPHARVWLCLLIFAAILIGLMLYWLTFAISSQGRLLFPGISAYGAILIGGIYHLLRRIKFPQPNLVLVWLPLVLLVSSIYALTDLLPASYAASVPVAAVPSTAQPVGKIYGDLLELVAVDLPQGRFYPGDEVPVTLYMRAKYPVRKEYQLFLQFLNENAEEIGNITTIPGWGRNPVSLWDPDLVYADTYLVRIFGDVSNRSPLSARVYGGFFDGETQKLLPLPNDTEDLGLRTLGYVEVAPLKLPQVNNQPYLALVDVQFSDGLALQGAVVPTEIASSQSFIITLLWHSTTPPTKDYTAFVHLIDSAGNYVTGHDQSPAEGRFPTSLWHPGDTSLSDFTLNLPADLAPGNYKLWAGLYDPASPTLDRLPITASDLPTQDNRVQLGTVVLP